MYGEQPMMETRRTRGLRLFFAILTLFVLNITGIASSQDATPEATPEATAEGTPPPFSVGNELTIAALRELEIEPSDILIEQQLDNGANYSRYIASYISEGFKIYGLLTIPFGDVPEGGFKAVVFNHGY